MTAWMSAEPGVLFLLIAKISFILVTALVCTRRLAKAAAGARHLVWTIALAMALLMPLLALGPSVELPILAPATHGIISPAAQSPELQPLSEFDTQGRSTREKAASERRAIDWFQILAGIYALGVAAVLLPLLVGHVRASRLKRTATPLALHAAWNQAWTQLPSTGRRSSQILVSNAILAPVTFGVYRPTILLPEDSAAWSREHRQSALIHELEHVSRADWLTQALGALACAAYWFHPLVWFGARRLHLEAERACDERVLRFGTDPRDYAQQLVDLTRQHHRNSLQAAVAMASGSELADRVYSVLQNRRNPMNTRLRTAVLAAAIAFLGVSTAAIVPTRANPTPDAQLDRREETSLTPLMQSARDGDLAGVRERLSANESVDATAGGRTTALILASTYGHGDIVDALLEAGADVDQMVRGTWRDELSRTALVAAASNGHLSVVRALLDAGAEVDRHGRGDASALMEACEKEHVGIVRLLIDRGADVDQRIKGDGNAVIAAARGGSLKIMKMLVDAGADVNAGVAGDGNALIMAVRSNDRPLVEYLLEQGADPNKYVAGDETAMLAAAESGDQRMMRLLLAATEGD
jgi:beta-lactamase regulating signal transducer with metallopeptidase domain/ankyrin repeat protein